MQRFDSSSSDFDDSDPLVAPLARTAIDFEAMGAVIDDIATSLAELLAGVAPRFRPPLAFESEPEQRRPPQRGSGLRRRFPPATCRRRRERRIRRQRRDSCGPWATPREDHRAARTRIRTHRTRSDGDDIAVHRISHGRLRSLRPPAGRGWAGDLARAVHRVQPALGDRAALNAGADQCAG